MPPPAHPPDRLSTPPGEIPTPTEPGPDADRIAERLGAITRVLGSDAAGTNVLGTDPARLARRRDGEASDPDARDRIIGLNAVIAALSDYLAESRIPKWLGSINSYLGNRSSAVVLRKGCTSEVIAAIEARRGGSFA